MDMYKRKRVRKSKYALVFAAVFLCLLIAGTATATNGKTVGITDVEPDGDAGRPTKFVTVYESSWPLYTDYGGGLSCDGNGILSAWSGEYIAFGFYDLSYDYLHQIKVWNSESEDISGVGWVFVYRK